MNLKVVDDAGQSVASAKVGIAYSVFDKLHWTNVVGRIEGLTDTNGIFAASHEGAYSLGLQVEKEGYYPVNVVYELTDRYRPELWNLNPTWMLKKIIKPTAMYARLIEGGPPVFNEPVGYDLSVGDWVAPHGRGVITDLIFTGNIDKKGDNDFDYKLTVSFPNLGDGIQEFTTPPVRFFGDGSALRSSQLAPADGYQPEVIKTMSRHPGQPSNSDMNNEKKSYYFRVKTVLDEQGKVKSALYGKIYGDFMQFRYYLNPTPNDRNVEFDPKQNLLKNLKSPEQVTAP